MVVAMRQTQTAEPDIKTGDLIHAHSPEIAGNRVCYKNLTTLLTGKNEVNYAPATREYFFRYER